MFLQIVHAVSIKQETQGVFATLFMLSRLNKERRMVLQIVHAVSIEQEVQTVFANLFMLSRLNKLRTMSLQFCSHTSPASCAGVHEVRVTHTPAQLP